jgi:FkbM family methyltransferase
MAIAVALTRNPIRTKTINGITYELDLREVIDSSLYFTSTYEVKIDRLFEKYVTPGSTVIDIGANIGLHTLRSALLAGEKGKVIAIEPSTWAIKKLQKNVSLNQSLRNRIVIRQVALGDVEQTSVSMNLQSSYRLNGRNAITTESVNIASLDTIGDSQGVANISIIKIDVDGHELAILRGGLSLISKNLPTLIVEFTPSFSSNYLKEFQQLETSLRKMGYEFFTENEKRLTNLSNFLEDLPHGHSAMVLIRPE